LAFVDEDQFNGSPKLDPFVLKPHDVSEIKLYVGGKTLPNVSIRTEFRAGSMYESSEAYLFSMLGLGKAFHNADCMLTQKMFTTNRAIFVFDVNPHTSTMVNCFSPATDGGVRVSIVFSTAPTKALRLLLACSYENTIMIDKARNVFTNYL
jgi:hypothetical protein